MKLMNGIQEGDFMFHCPGCKQAHEVTTQRKNNRGAQWKFNGNMEEPTFNPSVHVWHYRPDGSKQTDCHSIITAGFIQFLNDCNHLLKGHTVELPQI